jgi:hypothetical protein
VLEQHSERHSDRDRGKVDRFEEVRCRLRSPRRITSRAGSCRPFTRSGVNSLRNRRIKRVCLLGRRLPVQAAFSPKEIEQIGDIERTSLTVTEEDLFLDDVSKSALVDLKVKVNYESLNARSEAVTSREPRLRN